MSYVPVSIIDLQDFYIVFILGVMFCIISGLD